MRGAIRGIDIYGAQFRSSDGNTRLDITGGNVRLRQSNGRYVYVNPEGIFGYYSSGSEMFRADNLLVTSRALGTTTANVYLAPDSNNEVRVVDIRDIPSDGEIESYSYRPLRSSGIYANFVENNAGATGNNLYLRPRSGGEVRITGANTTDAYYPLRAGAIYSTNFITSSTSLWMGTDSAMHIVNKGFAQDSKGDPIYRDVYANDIYNRAMITRTTNAYIGTDHELRVVNKGLDNIYIDIRVNWVYAQAIDHHGGGANLYLRPGSGGEARITRTGTTGSYLPMRAASFPTGSMAEYKQDINPYVGNALDIINRTTIYEYMLKSEVEEGIYRLRQGLVIGEGYNTPKEVVDGDGVEQYLMNSFSWKAIQELSSNQTNLEDELNWLKIENQHLKNKIEKLEEKIA